MRRMIKRQEAESWSLEAWRGTSSDRQGTVDVLGDQSRADKNAVKQCVVVIVLGSNVVVTNRRHQEQDGSWKVMDVL